MVPPGALLDCFGLKALWLEFHRAEMLQDSGRAFRAHMSRMRGYHASAGTWQERARMRV